jgi:pyruvate ferredoxin oxidoreductase gamma subunit
LVAETALQEGKYFQAFPEYGPERMGAPIRAFTRLSSSPISQHCQVTEPDVVVVLDYTLLGAIDVTDGLKNGGVLVVNTSLTPTELRAKLSHDKGRVYAVDASRIALDTVGRNIPNTPILGALLKATGIVNKESMLHEMRSRLSARGLSSKVVEANIEAFQRGYNEVQGN